LNNIPFHRDAHHKLLLTILTIFILLISLFIYKEVYHHRTNQTFILILFLIIFLFLGLIEILSSGKIIWIKSKLNISLCFFSIILTISLFSGNNITVNLGHYLYFLSYLILLFIVFNLIQSEKDFNTIVKVFLVSSFLVALYTLLQYYGLDPYYSYLGQLTSTIGQKNWISNYLAMIFPIAFSFFLLEANGGSKITFFLLLAILYSALMIGQSRGIWISIGMTLLFSLIIISRYRLWEVFRNNKKWLIVLLIFFLVITVIYSTENLLNKSRLTVIERAASTFDKDDPSTIPAF